MFLFSTPSLAVYLVLAIFYLANLAFFTANRQHQQKPNEQVFTTTCPHSSLSPPNYIILTHSETEIIEDHIHYTQKDVVCSLWYFDYITVIYDYFDYTAHLQDFISIEPEVYHSLFFRPPPIG